MATLVYLTIPSMATGVAVGQIAGGGSIQGTVTDPSGAVVPQATVTAVNVGTRVETTRQTTVAGFYVLSPLPAGEYNVRVAAPGFQTLVHEHVVVDALATVSLSLQLKIHTDDSTSVTVFCEPQLDVLITIVLSASQRLGGEFVDPSTPVIDSVFQILKLRRIQRRFLETSSG